MSKSTIRYQKSTVVLASTRLRTLGLYYSIRPNIKNKNHGLNQLSPTALPSKEERTNFTHGAIPSFRRTPSRCDAGTTLPCSCIMTERDETCAVLIQMRSNTNEPDETLLIQILPWHFLAFYIIPWSKGIRHRHHLVSLSPPPPRLSAILS
jgi:hypothetical protein